MGKFLLALAAVGLVVLVILRRRAAAAEELEMEAAGGFQAAPGRRSMTGVSPTSYYQPGDQSYPLVQPEPEELNPELGNAIIEASWGQNTIDTQNAPMAERRKALAEAIHNFYMTGQNDLAAAAIEQLEELDKAIAVKAQIDETLSRALGGNIGTSFNRAFGM